MKYQTQFVSGLFAAAVLAGASHAQSWSRTYGGFTDFQGMYDMRVVSGDHMVVAGYTGNFGNWLMRLDLADGDVVHERVSNSSFGGFTDGAACAADGGALFLGRDVEDIFLKHDAWLMRVDKRGQPQWSLGFTRPGAGRHFLHDAHELSDGSWIAVGSTTEFDFTPLAAWVVRVSASGSLIWQFEYGGSDDTGRAVVPTADGGFAIAGTSGGASAGFRDVWIMKINSLGTVMWEKVLGGADDDQADDIVELADGRLVVVGSTNSLTASGHAPWIVCVDGGGGFRWQRVVDDNVWGDFGGVAETSDGNVVAVGRAWQDPLPTNDLFCAKFDAASGNVIWQRSYQGASGDLGTNVLPFFDAGGNEALMVGGTWAWGLPGEAIWLTRADANGSTGCGYGNATNYSLKRPKFSYKNSPLLRRFAHPVTEDPGMQTTANSATVSDVCQ